MYSDEDHAILVSDFKALTSLSTWFKNDTTCSYFRELADMNITKLGQDAFYGSHFIELVLPKILTEITQGSLEYATVIKSITIPHSVTTIGIAAFYGCTALASVNYEGTVAECKAISWDTYGSWVFYDVPAKYIQCTDGQVQISGGVPVIDE